MVGIIIAFKDYRFDAGILDTADTTAIMHAIYQTSANPEKAMQVLEEFNTNAELYNLLSRGIEGEHWVWADEANLVIAYPEGVTADTSPYNPNPDWVFGNQFNAYSRDHKQMGAWEATKIMNDTPYPSRALGFAVERTPIETEIVQVVAVWDELVKPIEWGGESHADNHHRRSATATRRLGRGEQPITETRHPHGPNGRPGRVGTTGAVCASA